MDDMNYPCGTGEASASDKTEGDDKATNREI